MERRERGTGTTRRQFFQQVLAWIGGLISLGIGAPLLGFGVLPALKEEESGWARLGPVELFPTGEPTLVPMTSVSPKPWPEEPVKHAVYVLKKGETEFVVYDIRCTHGGCPVRWVKPVQKFFSPCHGGVFDVDGRVLAGPPPRPLDRYEVKIEDGVLYVGKLYRVDRDLKRMTRYYA